MLTFKKENRNAPQQQNKQTRTVRHIQEQQKDKEREQEDKTVDAESALYIKELIEDWASVNTVRPSLFE